MNYMSMMMLEYVAWKKTIEFLVGFITDIAGKAEDANGNNIFKLDPSVFPIGDPISVAVGTVVGALKDAYENNVERFVVHRYIKDRTEHLERVYARRLELHEMSEEVYGEAMKMIASVRDNLMVDPDKTIMDKVADAIKSQEEKLKGFVESITVGVIETLLERTGNSGLMGIGTIIDLALSYMELDDVAQTWEDLLQNILRGTTDDDHMEGGMNNDTIYGNDSSGGNRIHGYGGDDWLYAYSEELLPNILGSHVIGGSGNDNIFGSFGNDHLYGDGDDSGRQLFAGDDATSDHIYGYFGNDYIYGNDGADVIFGDTQDGEEYHPNIHTPNTTYSDTIQGDMGDDKIYGGLGIDRIEGGDGIDHIYGGDENDQLWGGADNDLLAGYHAIHREDESIKLSLSDLYADVYLSVTSAGHSIHDPYGSNIGVYETEDFLIIYGRGSITEGRRIIISKDYKTIYVDDHSIDRLFGGKGEDTIYGGGGNDVIYGDNQIATSDNHASDDDDGIDTIYGGNGEDEIRAGGGNDKLYGYEAYGAENKQLIYDDAVKDEIYGGDGIDYIYGGGGGDHLEGGKGNDHIYGYIVLDISKTGSNYQFDDRLSISSGGILSIIGFPEAVLEMCPDGRMKYISKDNKIHYIIVSEDKKTVIIDDDSVDYIYGGEGEDTLHGGGGVDYVRQYQLRSG